MRKSARFKWTDDYARAFNEINGYLANPPCLSKPLAGDTLVVYLSTADHAVSAALVREEGNEQRPIYFVSHVLRDVKTRYPPLEKMTYALTIAARRLKSYFQAHPIKVFTRVSLKKALTDFKLSGRLLAWVLELTEYDITYHPRTALKSQILTDFIAEYSRPKDSSNDKWTLHIDDATSRNVSGAGVVLIDPMGEALNYALHFLFPVTNNVAEYETIIAGIKLTKELGAHEACLHSDSQLAIKQINGEIQVLDEKLIQYRK